MNLCGGDHKEAAYNIPIIVEIAHNEKQFKLEFRTTLDDDSCEHSLGIDNIEISIK